MSSDEEDNSSFDENSSTNKVALDIANAILFGNIDNDGFLTDDIFNEECKKQLGSLQQHLDSVVPYKDIIETEKYSVTESDNSENENVGASHNNNEVNNELNRSINDSISDNCKFVYSSNVILLL